MHATTATARRLPPPQPLSCEKLTFPQFGPVARLAAVAVIRTPGPPSVTHALVLAPQARITPAWTRAQEQAFQAAIRVAAAAKWPDAITEIYGVRV